MITDFNGAKITTVFRTFASDALARGILEGIKRGATLSDEQLVEASVTAIVLSCTVDVSFDPEGLGEEMDSFRGFWVWVCERVVLSRDSKGRVLTVDQDSLSELWSKYQSEIGNNVSKKWYEAFENAQRLYPARPEMSINPPQEMMTDKGFLAEGT